MIGKQLQRLGTNRVSLSLGRIIPPEQCRANGGKIDDRSDVYSLAVVLFEMLSGRPPFKANAPGELIAMHIIEPAPSIDAFVKDVPQVLQELFARTLSKSPDERPSMREVLGVLSGLAEGAPTVAVPAVQTIEVPQAPGPRPSLRKAAVTASPSSSSEAAPREPRRSFPIAALLSAGVLLACIGAFAAWHLSTRGEAGARTASGVPLSPPRPAPSAPPAVAERSAGAAAPPSTPPPAPVPAPAAAALPATPEPALPAPPLRRAAGDRRRNKPGPPRSSESGGSHELNVTPVF